MGDVPLLLTADFPRMENPLMALNTNKAISGKSLYGSTTDIKTGKWKNGGPKWKTKNLNKNQCCWRTEISKEIQIRCHEGRVAAKARGVKFGRPSGPGKSKLDKYEEEIVALLKTGSRQNYIAKKYGTTPANLCLWLKKKGLNNIKPEYWQESTKAARSILLCLGNHPTEGLYRNSSVTCWLSIRGTTTTCSAFLS